MNATVRRLAEDNFREYCQNNCNCRKLEDCKLEAFAKSLLELAAKEADKERSLRAERASENNGRESDFAFGSVSSSENIAQAIRALLK